MNFKNPPTPEMPNPVTRTLRRLWVVECFDGDPDDPDVGRITKTCVAWNQADAIRTCGKVAELPQHKCFVTWPLRPGGPIYEIYATSGPTEVEVITDIPIPDSDDDWNF